MQSKQEIATNLRDALIIGTLSDDRSLIAKTKGSTTIASTNPKDTFRLAMFTRTLEAVLCPLSHVANEHPLSTDDLRIILSASDEFYSGLLKMAVSDTSDGGARGRFLREMFEQDWVVAENFLHSLIVNEKPSP